MVIFNELSISNDKETLVIDCQVEGLSTYNNMYIKTIYLDYYKNAVNVGTPSDKALLVYNNSGDDTSVRSVRKCVDTQDLATVQDFGTGTFDKGLFYVIVTCDGTLPASIASLPCGSDNTVDVGVVLDWKWLYSLGMQYVAAMNSRCADPCVDLTGFKSFLMMWYALRLSAEACDYAQLQQSWEALLRVNTFVGLTSSKGCGCNG